MKKATTNSGSDGGFKSVLSRKKRKNVALEESVSEKKVPTKITGGCSWNSETGNTTESESIDIEEECLVEETSFDYGESGTIANGDLDQMSKGPGVKTKKALGKPLGRIDFSDHNDVNDDVLLDISLELPPSLKNLVAVSVRKSFALDISLDKVVGKSFQEKLIVVRNLFSRVNGFGEASTSSKFSEIICASFISESSLAQATKKARAANILVNTDLKKSSSHLDRAVMVKEILVGTSAEAVHTVLTEFGSVVLIKIQLVRLWQKTVKDAVRVAKANADKKSWNTKDQHKALLYILPMDTNVYDIWDFIGSVGGKTCARCAVVCFDFAALINAVMETTPVLKSANLHWSYMNFAKCTKCENLGHTSLNCFVGEKVFPGGTTHRMLSNDDKSRLASIYARCFASISHPVSFGSVSWANIVDRSSFLSLLICYGLAASSSFSVLPEVFGLFLAFMKPIPMMSMKLNDRFATLEHSFASLAEHIDKLAKRLDSFEPTNQGVDIIMSKGSGVATSDETIVEVAVFDSLVVSKMEETLKNLSVTVMGLSAKIDNAGLLVWKFAACNIWGLNVPAKQKNIMDYNRFEGVCIFTFRLIDGYLGAGVVIVMNNSLVRHVFKVEKVPGCIILMHLLFKSKVLVSIIGLYACAFPGDQFEQAPRINFFIAQVGKSMKNTSFGFCLNIGLVNSFGGHSLAGASMWDNSRDIEKVIDHVFVSESLILAVAGHRIESVTEFFDTDYRAILVSVGLSGLLDMHLAGIHRHANMNH
ncbi:hypothetical protein G9A89_022211 [Geosiphon pyriformis]|nr:hypothetical protein G9A89_022211 [Geosiphon pyriformis]